MRYFILLLSTLAIAAGCSKPASQPAPQPAATAAVSTTPAPSTDVQTVMINVPTAKCEECEGTIAKAAKTVDGVTDVKVDASTHTAQVKLISTRATKAQVEKAISDAGYTANDVKRNPAAYDKLESCCK